MWIVSIQEIAMIKNLLMNVASFLQEQLPQIIVNNSKSGQYQHLKSKI